MHRPNGPKASGASPRRRLQEEEPIFACSSRRKGADPRGLAVRRARHDRGAAGSPPSRPAPRRRRATSATRSWRRRPRTCTATPSSGRWPGSPKLRGRRDRHLLDLARNDVPLRAVDVARRRRGGRRAALCGNAGGGLRRGRRVPLSPPRPRRFALRSRARKWPSASLAAARRTGIGLTLLPVFYAHSTFGGAPPDAGQRRFINDRRVVRASRRRLPPAGRGATRRGDRHCAAQPARRDARTNFPNGHAIGRATARSISMSPSRSRRSRTASPGRARGRSVAPRPRAASTNAGAWSTPPTWTDGETRALARRGAVAGLCPVTEANLGDGIFNAAVPSRRRALRRRLGLQCQHRRRA